MSRLQAMCRVIAMATLVGAFGACRLPFAVGPEGTNGTLEVHVDPRSGRSIRPDTPDPVTYVVNGLGPDGAHFSLAVESFPAGFETITPGEWTISVEGYGDGGLLLLEGTARVVVTSSTISLVTISLVPRPGTGTVSLSLDWAAPLLANPRVGAILYGDDEPPIDLPVSVDAAAGTATVSAPVATGWYRLELLLWDGDQVVGGEVDLVEVALGVTTSAEISFSDPNKPGAPIVITGDSFTLMWDDSDVVDHFNLYYREHGTWEWSPLGETTDAIASFAVDAAVLDYGVYDFAVTAVDADGTESVPHTSLDDDADPQTGWYVVWGP